MRKIKTRQIIIGLALLVLLILLFRKCSPLLNSVDRSDQFTFDQSYKFIPPGATFICAFDLPSILEKIDFSTLKSSEKYVDQLRSFYNQNPPFTRVFNDPESAGVDTDKKAIFYVDVGNNDEEVYSASILPLKNSQAFYQMIQLNARMQKVSDAGSYKSLKINPIAAVAWNKNSAMFISTNEQYDEKEVFDQVFDPDARKYFDDSDDFFGFMEKSTSDLSFWLDLTSYANHQIHATGEPGEFNPLFLKGNTLYGQADFKKGEIDLELKYEFNTILQGLVDNIFKPDFDLSIFNNVLPRKPSFIGNVSLNISGLLNLILRDIDAKVEARNSLIPYGLTLEDFSQAASGDMVFAFYPNEDTGNTSTLFILKMEDEDHFMELVSIWEQLGKIVPEGNNTYVMRTGYLPFLPIESTYEDNLQRMLLKDGYMHVSLDRKVIDFIRENDAPAMDPAAFGIDINNSSDNLLSIYGTNEFKELSDYANRFSIKDYTLNYKNKSLLFHFNLQDQNTSSLKQLLAL